MGWPIKVDTFNPQRVPLPVKRCCHKEQSNNSCPLLSLNLTRKPETSLSYDMLSLLFGIPLQLC